MSWIVLPHLQVASANIVQSQIAMGGPPLMAGYLGMHAMCRQAGLGAMPIGIVFVHHSIEPLGQWFYGVFHPQQRRGASFTFSAEPKTDYSSTNAHALSLQPTASAHLGLSLLVETDREVVADEPIARWLDTGRFAGGQIMRYGRPKVYDTIDAALDESPVRSGFVVVDRRDLLDADTGAHLGSDPSERLVQALGRRLAPWLSATTVGYAAITPFARRGGVRAGDADALHAFAEPLVGLVQHRSLRNHDGDPEHLVWRPSWPSDDVFVLSQTLPEPTQEHAR